jgi:transketolase
MKVSVASAIEQLAKKDKKIVFLTGDLGFNAFERLRDTLGDRFINAGVAEQNMVSVAAGLSHVGLKPWVYSISTFLTLKTVEQVRNDICHLDLPVKLVGFGGGYGYGIMGESHHLLEDLAIYSSFPNMQIFIPAFEEDIIPIIHAMNTSKHPCYLRLNLAPKTTIELPKYAGIRQLSTGKKLTVVVLGTLTHHVLEAVKENNLLQNLAIFCVTEFPLKNTSNLISSVTSSEKLLVIEEHAASGGVAEKLLTELAEKNAIPKTFFHLYAKGYPSGLYGDHAFHQAENDLDPKGILKHIKKLLRS